MVVDGYSGEGMRRDAIVMERYVVSCAGSPCYVDDDAENLFICS